MKKSALDESLWFIFDFDGTLCDSRQVLIDIVNELAPYYKLNRINECNLIGLQYCTTRELLAAIGIKWFKLPFFVRSVRKRMRARIDEINWFAGMPEALIALKKINVKVGILTSNSAQNVSLFIKRANLQVEHIVGDIAHNGKNKALVKMKNSLALKSHHCVYIGDEVRDIEASHYSGIYSGAVTWGFCNGEILARHNPDYVFYEPDDIVALAQRLLVILEK